MKNKAMVYIYSARATSVSVNIFIAVKRYFSYTFLYNNIMCFGTGHTTDKKNV